MEMIILSDGTLINYEVDDTNCKIVRSFLVKPRKIKYEFLNRLLLKYPQFKVRSIKSYYKEWKAHNILYRLHICKSGTRDTDLDIHESLARRIGYFIISILTIDF